MRRLCAFGNGLRGPARQHPVPMRFVGVRDTFAESGSPEGVLAKYGLTAADIVREATELMKK